MENRLKIASELGRENLANETQNQTTHFNFTSGSRFFLSPLTSLAMPSKTTLNPCNGTPVSIERIETDFMNYSTDEKIL